MTIQRSEGLGSRLGSCMRSVYKPLVHIGSCHCEVKGGFVDCPRPIKCPTSILPHMVGSNQALHENTKVTGPGVKARLSPGTHCLCMY